MIWKGFRFGLLLQLAVGPVCLFIFQTAAESGFLAGLTGVAGVVLVDALFIFAAIQGIAALMERKHMKTVLKLCGAAVLILFGLATILSVFHISILPGLHIARTSGSAFFSTVLLTVSNPLTIIFWAGVFTAKISEEHMTKKGMYAFGAGALLATPCFLSLSALLGSAAKAFLPAVVIAVLNLAVGCLLVFFGVRMLLKKELTA